MGLNRTFGETFFSPKISISLMKINHFPPIIVAFCFVTLLYTPVLAQQFENTFGSLANHEEPQDGKPIPNSQYIVLSNSLSYGPASRIVLTRLNSTGSVALFATINELGSPTTAYYGNSIDLELNAAGVHTGYLIAGSRSTANGRQALLIRTNTSGTVTWTKALPNFDASGNLDERGVSVERQPNGDVILTTSGYNAVVGNYRFSVSRFNSVGTQLWSNRYYANTSGQSFEATEACNAIRSGAETIVVTGRFWVADNSNPHSFLSCINAGTGVEIWRRSYDSGFTADAGLDVVYKPANGGSEPAALMAVGRAGLQATTLWVIRANPLNGIASTKTYAPNVFFSGFSGVAVNLDVTGTRAAITGSIVYQPNLGTYLSGTYVMAMPFYGTELPDWAYYYASSSPQFTETHSIAQITGALAGYFVTCGSRITGSAFNDVHSIRINSLGSTGGSGCNTEPITVIRTLQGSNAWRAFNRTPYTWTNIMPSRSTRSFAQEFCTEALLNVEEREKSQSAMGTEVQLYPNPSASGHNAILAFELSEETPIQIRVFDLTGREIWSSSQTLEPGVQTLDLPAGQWLNGTYFVQMKAADFNQTLKFVVSNQ